MAVASFLILIFSIGSILFLRMLFNKYPANSKKIATRRRIVLISLFLIAPLWYIDTLISKRFDKTDITGNNVTKTNRSNSYGYNGNKTTSQLTKQVLEIPLKIPYKIVYTLNDVRADKKSYFLVLVNPVNLNNDSFKVDIARVVDEIVKDAGREISVDVFDNDKALELVRKSNDLHPNSGFDLYKSQYYNFVAVHLIAQYTGMLFTNMNGEIESKQFTIDFFPSGENIKEVAAFVDHIDLN